MRVLITGATGLVGSNIANKCIKKGIEVNYLTTSKDKIENKPNYKGFYWNASKNEIDANCITDVDAIIHLAGASIAKRWTSSYKEEIIDSRVETAKLIFNTLKSSENSVSQFISASAIGIYPSSLQKLYTEEESNKDDSFLTEVVEKWEAAADRFKELKIKVSKVRTGLVLAKDGGALQKMKEPADFNLGAAFGSGKQWQSWIHIEDLANLYIHILEKNLVGVYNGVAPNPVTNSELMEGIAKQLDKNVWLPNVPAIALKVALGDMSTVVLSSQLVSSDKIENTGFSFKYKNLTKALEDLL
ncbi:TIGR01777 family oxidoreductase [Gillisia sp. CAL575]|uniref:TIGR01777 family oxidoreductase n=1 Tax=Gillisia sp. CAL575 TaxID=985255 RepID=UPI00039B8E1C|nr:TIGR01777 family oxidoreductase [Gillisia sp. CAL575]